MAVQHRSWFVSIAKHPAPIANVGGTFQATLNVSTLTLGIHLMSASYGGSSGFAASNTSLPAVQIVQ